MLVAVLVLLVVAVPYVYFIATWTRDRVHQRRCVDWPAARGTVLECEVRFGIPDQGARFKRFMLDIRYDYEVAGVRYESRRVRFGDTRFFLGEVEELAARYREGTAVAVRYDPDHPARAVLECAGAPTLTRIVLFAAGFGLFLVVALIFASVLVMESLL